MSVTNNIKEGRLACTINIQLEQTQEQELPEGMVYAYDRNGSFLDSAEFPRKAQFTVELALPSELQGDTIRILIGPQVSDDSEEMPEWMRQGITNTKNSAGGVAPSVLVRKGAYEKRVQLAAEHNIFSLPIFPHDWKKWLLCRCVVRGRLIKLLQMPDGTNQELGVCNACIKIYEVDKLAKIIARLPDRDLSRIRDDLLILIKNWPPNPPLEKIPSILGPSIEPPPPLPVRPEATSPAAVLKSCDTGEVPDTMSLGAEPPLPDKEVHCEYKKVVTMLAQELEPVFTASSVSQLRNALIIKAGILAQLICQWKWLHFHFSKDLIKCVSTDEQGRFETTITYPCGGDRPDLYFKAMQCIASNLHILYDPNVACHTHWNYKCGSEVVLVTTDPVAITCMSPEAVEPPSGVTIWIMPYAVGGTPLNKINQPSGLTDYGSIVDAPFGNIPGHRLGFRHGYSSNIPTTGLFFYRWQYKKDGETKWHDFSEPVVRHYIKEEPGKLPTYPVCTLGPKSVSGMHLYRFKPHKPEECSDFIPGGYNSWPVDDWFADIYSGFINTYGLPGGVDVSAGRYQIKLEIYKENGIIVKPGPTTFQFIIPIGKDTDGATILSRKAESGEIDGDGFVFYLHIDNRSCQAMTDAPTIGTTGADPQCGFLHYHALSEQVQIDFHALHPANYATFSFRIKRSATDISGGDGEVTDLTINGYHGDGNGNFSNLFTVNTLLNTCTRAAFSENLWVEAKATNGWARLHQYDSYIARAFALAPAAEAK
ncbi:MAG: hypothetical protein KKD01_00430 [Proteobacteria bacterium]|nr:hypothetical protein [Pseudomonadota bacterium]MBU1233527.1 hypothetical protein [Pseudomonadota bacterium]MBU1417815.1 hypothetical protein [Pseudomonadota bacterium]MBU1453163.1 hypothetical protein [Pseudomonadota bacterium]